MNPIECMRIVFDAQISIYTMRLNFGVFFYYRTDAVIYKTFKSERVGLCSPTVDNRRYFVLGIASVWAASVRKRYCRSLLGAVDSTNGASDG